MPVARVTAAAIDRLVPGQTLWDTEVRGFGVRRQVVETVFVFKAISPVTRKQIFVTIGRRSRGEWTIDDARKKATEFRLMIRDGQDPSIGAKTRIRTMTVAELCDAYLADVRNSPLDRVGRPKKESTLATDRGRIEGHVKPLMGDLPVSAVTLADVETFLQRVARGDSAKKAKASGRGAVPKGGKGTASRTVGLLGAVFSFAVRRGLREDNPVRGVRRFADQKRERRFSDDEWRCLAAGLAAMAERYPAPVACIRFLALTGWRRGEAVNLRWNDIDAARRTAVLGDTKTGRSMRPLAHAAIEIIGTMPRHAGSEFVFPATTGAGPVANIPDVWARVREAGALPADLTPHTLRHSAASIAADLGFSEATIAALLGHKGRTTTSRYTHAADAALLAAADKVAAAVMAAMGEEQKSAEVVPLRR